MPRFSQRRVLNLENAMFRLSGRPILLITRTDNAPAYTPGQLFATDTEPEEASTTVKRYIFAKFEETDMEEFGGSGRKRAVKGVLTVPMLYKAFLGEASYIDPYLDGSRFRKVGATVNESRSYITQAIEAFSLASPAEVE